MFFIPYCLVPKTSQGSFLSEFRENIKNIQNKRKLIKQHIQSEVGFLNSSFCLLNVHVCVPSSGASTDIQWCLGNSRTLGHHHSNLRSCALWSTCSSRTPYADAFSLPSFFINIIVSIVVKHHHLTTRDTDINVKTKLKAFAL